MKKSKKTVLIAVLLVISLLLSSINLFATYCADDESTREVNECIQYTGSNVTSTAQEDGSYLVELTGDADEDFTVRSTDTVVLDLKGHKFTNYSTPNATIVIENGGSLTIKDSEGEGTISQKEGTNGVETIVNKGTLVIESGTITNVTKTDNLAIIRNESNGSLTMTGGKVTGANECIQNLGTATLSGGTVEGTGNFYSVRNEGTMTISGETAITGTSTNTSVVGNIKGASSSTEPELTISGGSISGTTAALVNHNGTTVIEDGNLESTGTAAVSIDGGSITIENGKFTSPEGTEVLNVGEDAVLLVKGGTYSSDVTEYLAEGLEQNENGEVIDPNANTNDTEESKKDDTPKTGIVNYLPALGLVAVVTLAGVVIFKRK